MLSSHNYSMCQSAIASAAAPEPCPHAVGSSQLLQSCGRQRRGAIAQVVQKLNPSEDHGLSVVSLFSAAKSYLEGKKKPTQNSKNLLCLAWLLCVTALSPLTPQSVLTLSVPFIALVINSLEYQYLIFNIYGPFSE